jgi:hypothetical protein
MRVELASSGDLGEFASFVAHMKALAKVTLDVQA